MITASKGWATLRLAELWEYRELVAFLAWRDLSLRYRQTFLGAAWAVLQPLLAMAVFSLVFGRFARLPSDGLPYPLFAFCGLVSWQCFSTALMACSNSLVGNAPLLSKVYFPRLVLPIASVVPAVVDMLVSSVFLAALMLWYGVTPRATTVWVPVVAVLPVLAAIGVGLWLSALAVEYRDVRHVLPFLVQLWFFATPVVYPASLLPPRWVYALSFNPMVGAVEGLRGALMGRGPRLDLLVPAVAVTAGLLAGGALYFRRMERTFADEV